MRWLRLRQDPQWYDQFRERSKLNMRKFRERQKESVAKEDGRSESRHEPQPE